MTKGRETMALGRNFPPTILRWTAENAMYHNWLLSSQIGNTYNVMRVDMRPDGSGIRYYDMNNGAFTPQIQHKPRNWDRIIPLYKRGRVLSTSIKVELTWSSTAGAANANWLIMYWTSSELDKLNPLEIPTTLPTGSSPWSNDETGEKTTRTILSQSRRVTRLVKKSIGSAAGTSYCKFMVKLSPFRDRLGNMVIGGKHVRDASSHGGGPIDTTDKTVALLLTQTQGVNHLLNIVAMPAEPNNAQNVHHLTGSKITVFSHVELYDRVLDAP